ncbi:MAG: hypothetical protein P794_02440 [Epsilonproteobacteria bacterium (ex Lamellibrachia satsuma)]|nr:MAG: hypothetical protein P794_02440 [Epsilonproteobacteria bacterium (ex Lamellibrachia satsuma)]
MSFGDYVYIVVLILFSYMTFVIIKNNFLSKFDEEQRRKDLVDEYEDDYISDKTEDSEDKD